MEGRRDSGREQERETETQRPTERDWYLVGELLVHRGLACYWRQVLAGLIL